MRKRDLFRAYVGDPLGARLYLMLLKLLLVVLLVREYEGYYGIPVVAVLLLGQGVTVIELAVRRDPPPPGMRAPRAAATIVAGIAADAVLLLAAAAIAL